VPTVAVVDGVKILFYAGDHPPAHFHAIFAEYEAKIAIEDLVVDRGRLPPGKLRAVLRLGVDPEGAVAVRLEYGSGEAQAREDRLTDIIRMASAAPVLYGVVKIAWQDGYEGIVDLRSVIGDGDVFEFLRRSPERFLDVRLDQYGHRLFWTDDDGDEVDFGTESLRRRAERQFELLRAAG
jgi:hypothetical protein